mmetsp:Transcript_5265/g.5139  ORF Transcript_5265/g.5139 Transcript_5265/m.5139 type:complete len:145 (+) Transcript_5265:1-435(+)
MEMYQRLIAYKNQHQSTTVSAYKNRHQSTAVSRFYEEDQKLGVWVSNQRSLYKNKEISVERINYLESVGFIWKLYDRVPWIKMYKRLVAYKQRQKSTLVTRNYMEDPRLGRWVHAQRKQYSKGELLGKRTELLNSIDFVWSLNK